MIDIPTWNIGLFKSIRIFVRVYYLHLTFVYVPVCVYGNIIDRKKYERMDEPFDFDCMWLIYSFISGNQSRFLFWILILFIKSSRLLYSLIPV